MTRITIPGRIYSAVQTFAYDNPSHKFNRRGVHLVVKPGGDAMIEATDGCVAIRYELPRLDPVDNRIDVIVPLEKVRKTLPVTLDIDPAGGVHLSNGAYHKDIRPIDGQFPDTERLYSTAGEASGEPATYNPRVVAKVSTALAEIALAHGHRGAAMRWVPDGRHAASVTIVDVPEVHALVAPVVDVSRNRRTSND